MTRYFCLLFLFIFLTGCTNNKINTEESPIMGSWNWIESFGGIAGVLETPESTGNTIRLEVSNNTIKRFVNGELESSLNYVIETGDSGILGGQQEMIIYENGFLQSYIIDENVLLLIDECDDCFQHEYEKE